MKIFKNQKEVSEYASALKLPTPILAELSKSVSLVEVVREEIPSAQACVILLNLEEKKAEVLRNHRLTTLSYKIQSFFSELAIYRTRGMHLKGHQSRCPLFF